MIRGTGHRRPESPPTSSMVVLDVGGPHRASEQNVVKAKSGARPGALDIEADPVFWAATV